MLKFPACFEESVHGGFVVTFRDIPEAITQGDTFAQAHAMAIDALTTAMDFYVEDRRPVPLPSTARSGEHLLALPPTIVAKVLLHNTCLESRTRPADLARAMGIKPQEVHRILDLHHATQIDTLAVAFRALGCELVIQARPLPLLSPPSCLASGSSSASSSASATSCRADQSLDKVRR
ncbi:type II toxin-antitoxin system HicB family antitoxin [Curvibacter gracilis]|uniref:type II toxin-antitoxin system HicB family antitoxin n=1 Tax=Curvibacter gracilis TaxID=230310 RepID=UPI0004BACB41